MGKKIAIVVSVALAAAAVTGWALTASAKPPQRAAAAPTATYLDHTVTEHDIDNGKPGFSAGDQFVFHDVLKQNGNKVGTLDGFCEAAALYGHGGFFVCTAGAKLKGGQIQLQATLHFGRGNPPFNIGVTGGTGQYRTARGYAHVTPIKGTNGNDSKFQLYLVP